MYIQQIRNATLKIPYAHSTLLVDPWLAQPFHGDASVTAQAANYFFICSIYIKLIISHIRHTLPCFFLL